MWPNFKLKKKKKKSRDAHELPQKEDEATQLKKAEVLPSFLLVFAEHRLQLRRTLQLFHDLPSREEKQISLQWKATQAYEKFKMIKFIIKMNQKFVLECSWCIKKNWEQHFECSYFSNVVHTVVETDVLIVSAPIKVLRNTVNYFKYTS